MEAWDVLVIGDGPAALRSAALAAKKGAQTLLLSPSALGDGGLVASDGLTSAIQESNNKGHREDTIKAGRFLCDQDIVSSRTNSAIEEMDLLERWGVIFQRDAKGLPMAYKAVGHSKPRIVNSGDATGSEIQQILEEQCMRHGVVRRSDQIPMRLVHNNNAICGMITADMVNGNFVAIQCKSLILADGGFEDIFTNGKSNLGMDLALQSGISLRNMEFISKTPLAVKGTDMILPHGLLSSGASLHMVDGSELEGDSILEICQEASSRDTIVLDARSMGDKTKWWNSIFRNVKQRTGIDLSKQTLAVENKVNMTIGGLPADELGRVVVGSWSRWFTGLYAAGEASCSGFHGAGLLDGNRLLDSLVGGKMAGENAGEWSRKASFSGTELIKQALESVSSNFQSQFSEDESEGTVTRIGLASSRLREIGLSFVNGENSASIYQQHLESLEQLSILAESIHMDQESLIANTNLLSMLQVQAGIRLLTSSVQSSLARNESRGLHQRTDFTEHDSELLHHITIDSKGNAGILALRKSETGHWILPPQ